MKNQQKKTVVKLNEFLINFIELQIQKCFKILHAGIGPDVGLIAMLVKKEIETLITVMSRDKLGHSSHAN